MATLVQSKAGTFASTPGTITLTSPTTAGNCLIVCISTEADTTNPTVGGVTLGGAAGNFASAVSEGGGSDFCVTAIWADPNCAGGQTAVAISLSGAVGTITTVAWVEEWSGVATSSPVDKTAGALNTGVTSWSSGATATTTQAAELAIGAVGGTTSSHPTFTGPSSPWTNLAQESSAGTDFGLLTGYQVLSSTGTVTYSGTVSPAVGYSAAVATFKLSGAATVALTTPNIALAAPLLTPAAGATVALTTPNIALGAPLPVPGIGVALTTPNIALGAPLPTLTAGAKITLTTPSVALAAPLPSPALPFDILPAAPLFPAGYMNAMVELDLSGTWTDITPYTFRTPLTITRGHADESTTTAPSQCTGSLTNEDARFTGTSPLSPYFGSLMRNVPMRVSLPEGASYLRLETDQVSYASCPDAAGLDITGDMDVQLDLTLDNWRAPQILAAKYAQTGNQRTWKLLLEQDGSLLFVFSTNGTNNFATTSSEFGGAGQVPYPPLGRLCVRVTYQSSTGTVKFYTAPPGLTGASWTQLGDTSVFGAASLDNSTAPVQVGWCSDDTGGDPGYTGISGKVHAMLLLSGIGGTRAASPDFTVQAPGTTSFADAQSNTWTLAGTSAVSNRKYRFHGELSVLPQQWVPTFRQVWCDFTAAGVLRRLAQGTNPVNSAFYRANVRQTGTAYPVEYWPCEDAAGSSGFASAVGGTPMTFGPATQLASNSSFACSAAIPALNGAQWAGTVTRGAGVTWTSNVIRFIGQVPSGGDTNGGILCRVYTTGTIRRLDLSYGTGGALAIEGYDINGVQLITSPVEAFGVNGQLLLFDMELNPSGGNVSLVIATAQPNAAGLAAGPFTLSTATVGAVTSVQINPGGLLTGTAIGHVSVQSVTTSIFALESPLGAWLGETAGNRIQRLCGEEGITFRGRGQLSASAPMGVQTLQTLPDLLQECADTDRGIIFEPRQVLGLGYRCLNSIEAQSAGGAAAAVAWDFNQNEMDMPSAWPLEDDQRSVNDVTVTSATGSSSHQVVSSGPMNVQAPGSVFGAIGRYAQAYTVNPQSDSQLPNIGGWILHVGSVNEPRYPSVAANLANTDLSAALFYAILDADLGDLTSGANPPAWLPPGIVRQLIQGTTETIFVKQLTVDWAAVPASPYDVGIVGDAVYGHVDTDGSVLASGATSSATTLSVATISAVTPAWTTAAGDFPFDIRVNYGEVMTVTNITGSSGSPAVVQSAQNKGTGTSVTVTLGSPTTAGNCLVVVVNSQNATTNATVSGCTLGGGAGNFGSLASFGTGASNSIESFWADPNCAGSQTSVVVTMTGGSGAANVFVSVLEVSGLPSTLGALLDQDAGAANTSGSLSFSSGSTATTTQASELWVGGVGGGTSSTLTITGPAGPWVNLAQQSGGSTDAAAMAGYQFVTATGTAAYAGTLSPVSGFTAGVVALSAPGTGQSFAVTRGVNGVQVAHNAGEDVRLAHPMIIALT